MGYLVNIIIITLKIYMYNITIFLIQFCVFRFLVYVSDIKNILRIKRINKLIV